MTIMELMGLCCGTWGTRKFGGIVVGGGGRQIARVAKLSYNVQDYVVYAASPLFSSSSSSSSSPSYRLSSTF